VAGITWPRSVFSAATDAASSPLPWSGIETVATVYDAYTRTSFG
jgi:hypothetical protein